MKWVLCALPSLTIKCSDTCGSQNGGVSYTYQAQMESSMTFIYSMSDETYWICKVSGRHSLGSLWIITQYAIWTISWQAHMICLRSTSKYVVHWIACTPGPQITPKDLVLLLLREEAPKRDQNFVRNISPGLLPLVGPTWTLASTL